MAVSEVERGNCEQPREAGGRIALGRGEVKTEVVGVDASVEPESSDILHGLNNVLVSILLNAQIIEWKLPSYSRLRRNLHEVERSAQRGAALVKRLRNGREPEASVNQEGSDSEIASAITNSLQPEGKLPPVADCES
jgi:hypothetical protein